MHPLFDLSGRVALVTGGSKGLGKAMARGFAEAGANVVISSRHEDELKAAAAEIAARHQRPRSPTFVADMTKRDDVKKLADDGPRGDGHASTSWSTTPAATCRSRSTRSPTKPGTGSSS